MIYFIQAETGQIKVGYAKDDITKRVKNLQCASPVKLELIHSMEGDIFLEKAIHREFKKSKIKNEWFALSEKLHNFIKNPWAINTRLAIPNSCPGMRLNTKRIRQELARLGWSPYRLSKEMGIANQTVYKLLKENGNSYTFKTVEKLADALGVDPKDLLS